MSDVNVSETEAQTLKNFLTEYASELGIAKSVIGELITDDFAKKLLKASKQYNWDQLRPMFTGSLSGLQNQNSLLLMRGISRGLAGLLKKAGPAAALMASIYDDWTSGGIPNETAKTLTQLAAGAAIGGALLTIGVSATSSIIVCGLVGYFICFIKNHNERFYYG